MKLFVPCTRCYDPYNRWVSLRAQPPFAERVLRGRNFVHVGHGLRGTIRDSCRPTTAAAYLLSSRMVLRRL